MLLIGIYIHGVTQVYRDLNSILEIDGGEIRLPISVKFIARPPPAAYTTSLAPEAPVGHETLSTWHSIGDDFKPL